MKTDITYKTFYIERIELLKQNYSSNSIPSLAPAIKKNKVNRKSMKNYYYITVLLFLINNTIFAQYGSSGVTDARSLGLGKTHTATSEGVFSIGINPSNLIFSKEGSIDFSTVLPLPSAGIRSGTDFLTYDDFQYYFGGIGGDDRILTEDDKVRINRLFENGGSFYTHAGVSLLSFSFNPGYDVGTFAFSVGDFGGGRFKFPQAIKDLSYTEGKVYDFSDASVEAWWVRSFSFSYARQLEFLSGGAFEKFGFGFSLKYYQGFGYIATEDITTYLKTNPNGTISGEANLLAYSALSDDFGIAYDFENVKRQSSLSIFPSPVGKGFGFDLGFSAKINHRWKVAASLTDIGQITWNKNTARFVSKGDIVVTDISNQAQRDSVFNKIFGFGEPIDLFVTSLATAIRFGSAFLVSDDNEEGFPGRLLLACDLNQGLNNMPGNSTNLRVSFGAEWRPWQSFPNIRTGVEFGGTEKLNWTYGMGFDFGFLEIHIATNAMQNLFFPKSSDMLSAAFSSRWKIN